MVVIMVDKTIPRFMISNRRSASGILLGLAGAEGGGEIVRPVGVAQAKLWPYLGSCSHMHYFASLMLVQWKL